MGGHIGCAWNSNGICTPGCISEECYETCQTAPEPAPSGVILQASAGDETSTSNSSHIWWVGTGICIFICLCFGALWTYKSKYSYAFVEEFGGQSVEAYQFEYDDEDLDSVERVI